MRLDSDLATIRHDILHSGGGSRVAQIEGDLSDPHNGGHSVLIVRFEDGRRVVYKPVMGGAATEVSGSTTKIAIESAWFHPATIRTTSRRLGLKTEASITVPGCK